LNLAKTKVGMLLSGISIVLISILFSSPAFASSVKPLTSPSASPALGIYTANPPRTFAGYAVTPDNVNGFAPYCDGGLIFCYTPADLARAYEFPGSGPHALTGSGQTIVIVDAFGSPTIQADLKVFDSSFNLPPVNLQILCGPTWTGASTDRCPNLIPGSSLDTICSGESWAYETTLDVSMAHALAPGAKIDLVVANSCYDFALNAAEAAVVGQASLKGSIMSQSFGEPDYMAGCLVSPCTTWNPAIVNVANNIYYRAMLNHWTVLASSGDDGANEDYTASGFVDPTLTPSWPSTNPYNLAVGGTMGNPYYGQYATSTPPFSCPAFTNCNTGLVIVNGGATGCGTGASLLPSKCSPVGYGGEQTWNEFYNFGVRTASGGGVSVIYGRPSYQGGLPTTATTLLGATVPTAMRTTPDVSFNSAINGGILNYDGFPSLWGGANGFYILGGTSAASPAWAAIIALLNQRNGAPVGFINSAIYALGQSKYYSDAFHDINTGENSDTAGGPCPFPYCPVAGPTADGFTASNGYDLTTGWGTPNVAHFISDILHFL
jgi:subtilase family serine protease